MAREKRAPSPTGTFFSRRDGPNCARQCADEPQNKQDDEHETDHAARARRAVAAMDVVAALRRLTGE
jgi:hypothetical protein